MTRTMKRVVLFVCLTTFGLYGADTAGAHKDYGICVGNCERRLEDASQQHIFGDPIYYEAAATGFEAKSIPASEHTTEPTDPRVERVRLFFEKFKSPAAKYSKVFIEVADQNDLDWYLLPSIAFMESGGGKVSHHNNIFGWDSGRARFPSIEEGIRQVGKALAQWPYCDKTSREKLKVYNHHARYQVVAARVMKRVQDIYLP